MVAIPSVPPFCFMTLSRVPEIRAPEQPNGWPKAIAPPCRLTFSVHAIHHFPQQPFPQLNQLHLLISSLLQGMSGQRNILRAQ